MVKDRYSVTVVSCGVGSFRSPFEDLKSVENVAVSLIKNESSVPILLNYADTCRERVAGALKRVSHLILLGQSYNRLAFLKIRVIPTHKFREDLLSDIMYVGTSFSSDFLAQIDNGDLTFSMSVINPMCVSALLGILRALSYTNPETARNNKNLTDFLLDSAKEIEENFERISQTDADYFGMHELGIFALAEFFYLRTSYKTLSLGNSAVLPQFQMMNKATVGEHLSFMDGHRSRIDHFLELIKKTLPDTNNLNIAVKEFKNVKGYV